MIKQSKKGVVETQFNWIFILIIGAVVLILFIGISARQKNISDTSIEISIINSLDAVFSGLETSPGTVSLISIPQTKIEFGCNAYSLGKTSKQINAMSIFAPSFFEGDKLTSMTLDFELPYRITTFIYLVSPETRYIFIGNSHFARKIFETVPEEIETDGYTNINAISNENDDRVRLIFFDQEPDLPESLVGKPLTALRVNGDEDSGSLEFFELVNGAFESKGTSNYIKKAALFGAIFSDDASNYDCSMENAFKKLNIVSSFYKEKIKRTIDYYEIAGDSCRQFYETEITQISDDLDVLSSYDFTPQNVPAIIAAASEIEKKNMDASKLSCALIY